VIMKPARPTNYRGRAHWLLAARLFVLIVALCAVPAQAAIKCTITDIRSCYRCSCCLVTCIDCVDTVTGETTSDCSTVYCYDRCV